DADPEGRHGQRQRAHAALRGHLAEFAAVHVLEQRKCLLAQRDIRYVGIAIVIEIAEVESHASDKIAILGQSDSQRKRSFLQLLAADVVEQERVKSVVRYENVRKSVVIVIGDADAHALADRSSNAPFL